MEYETKDYIFVDKNGQEYMSYPELPISGYLFTLVTLGLITFLSFFFTITV